MTRPASAAPVFRVVAEGSCPDQQELTQAVVAKAWSLSTPGDPRALPDYSLVSRVDTAGATLELRRFDGAMLVTRSFASRDCRALAEAMLVVVEAYFLDIGEPMDASNPDASIPPPPLAPPVATSPTTHATKTELDAAAPTFTGIAPALRETAPNHADAPKAGVTPPAPPNGRPLVSGAMEGRANAAVGAVSRPHGTVVLRKAATPTAPTPTPSEDPSAFIDGVRAFIGVGASLALPPNDAIRLAAPSAQLGAGVVFASIPVSTDVLLGSGLRTSAGEIPNRVERWAGHAIVRAGWPLRATHGELRPWMGAGIQLAALRAIDLPDAKSRTSISSLVGLGLEGTLPLSGNWSTRADVGCSLCGTREHYQVAPGESLGDGPRVICLAMLGVSFEKRP